MANKKKDKKKQAEQKREQRKKQRQMRKNIRKKMNSCKDTFKLTRQYVAFYQKFDAQLQHLHVRLKDVGGDGNCLFRSIADQLDGTENTHAYLREQACKYILAQQQFFRNFIDQDEQGNIHQYVQGMRKNGQWGGHLELQALSECLQCIIVIHKLHMQQYQITPILAQPKGTILHLAYFQEQDFEHYLSIRDLDDRTEEPAINGLRYLNQNIYSHLLALGDPEEYAIMKQMQELNLNGEGHGGYAEQGEYYEQEPQYKQEKPREPYPGFPPGKKCKCNSGDSYKNCCLKRYHRQMADRGYT